MLKKFCAHILVLFAFSAAVYSQITPNLQTSGSDSSFSQEKYYSLIKEYTIGYKDVFQTPYYAILGKTEHPKILVHGGMHGDEAAGFMACDTIIKNINVLEGTLIVIPRLNIIADLKNERYENIDLNHAFPGDQGSDIYEFRLAYEMMWLVDSIKPDIIINLHEAMTKYDSEAKDDSEKAFGQIVITCIKPYEDFLVQSVDGMNEKIPVPDYKFHVHYYSFREYSSMDNFISKFGIKSYTVETYRGFRLDDRIKLQQTAVLEFLDRMGMKYEYPEITFN